MRSALLVALLVVTSAFADEAPFATTWKMLRPEDRVQFLSGYIHGFRDASRMLVTVRDHLRNNPGKAEEAFDILARLLEVPAISPTDGARVVTEFYDRASNEHAPMSQAVSYCRSKLN